MRYSKFILILFIFVLAACAPESFQEDSLQTQTFQVFNSPAIELQSMPGNLQLLTGSNEEIKVSAQLIGVGASEKIAQANHDALILNLSQQGDTIFIVASQSLDTSREGQGWINYTITMPTSTTLDINMEPLDLVAGTQQAFTFSLSIALFLSMFVLFIILALLGRRLKLANEKIQSISVENRALRGSIHMKNIELENLEQKFADLKQRLADETQMKRGQHHDPE